VVSGAGEQELETDFDQAIAYLEKHTEVRDVLLSGGDPLLFSDEKLDTLLGRLRAIPHIEFVRIGSRVPIFLPQRITPELCAILKKHHPLFMSVHANHPRELTTEVRDALGADALILSNRRLPSGGVELVAMIESGAEPAVLPAPFPPRAEVEPLRRSAIDAYTQAALVDDPDLPDVVRRPAPASTAQWPPAQLAAQLALAVSLAERGGDGSGDGGGGGGDAAAAAATAAAEAAAAARPTLLVHDCAALATLGVGAFGEVLLCRRGGGGAGAGSDGSLVALKAMSKSRLMRKREVRGSGRGPVVVTALDRVQSEIQILRALGRHANVVALQAVLN
jgi:hypothetical protein